MPTKVKVWQPLLLQESFFYFLHLASELDVSLVVNMSPTSPKKPSPPNLSCVSTTCERSKSRVSFMASPIIQTTNVCCPSLPYCVSLLVVHLVRSNRLWEKKDNVWFSCSRILDYSVQVVLNFFNKRWNKARAKVKSINNKKMICVYSCKMIKLIPFYFVI